MMLAFKTPRISLNLLKCLNSHCIFLPKTGITLFINQRGYDHLEPPVVICTVILIVVNIATRQQHFQAASLLPQMMSANNRPGGELTRCSAVPLPLPPNRDDVPVPSSFGIAPPTATAVVGGCRCSLVIVFLLQTIAIIFLILQLPPKRMPILDLETRPRKATYNNDGSPALIHAHRQLLLLSARW
jgi:hypothetical protein